MNKITHPYYVLEWQATGQQWLIDLRVQAPYHHTRHLPQTLATLERCLPLVLTSECFNPDHLSFDQEVVSTETGHLLEHILLEELCAAQLKTGCAEADFQGETTWDWSTEEKGLYHISIEQDQLSATAFAPVLAESLHIFDTVLQSTKQESVNSPVFISG